MARRPRTPRRTDRGAALLVAVVSVAILTALATDLTYETQVRLRIAANARDELRATALAQSAVTLSRVVLSIQQQMDRVNTALCAAQQAGAPGGGAPGAGCTMPRLQVWNLVPVNSGFTQLLFADGGAGKGQESRPSVGEAGAAGAAQETGPKVVGMADFQGGFDARIEDEGQKINVQLDELSNSGQLASKVEALLRLVCDSKWDPLFDRDDAEGQRYSRADVLVHLRDWVDDDTNASALSAAFPGGNCAFVVQRNPFEKAFADEGYAYDRMTDRYRVKNHRFDSLDELHLVAGITDPFMAAFGDQLTVYLPQGAQLNVNTTSDRRQLEIADLMADPSARAKLGDEKVQALFKKALTALTAGGSLTITPVQFAAAVEAAGVKVRSEYLKASSTNSPFTDKSQVYRIRAMGVAGDVTHQIDAVVSFDEKNGGAEAVKGHGAAASDLPPTGWLIHWREE